MVGHRCGMTSVGSAPLAGQLLLSRNVTTAGDRAQFYSRVRKNELVPVVRGVYVDGAVWRALDRHERQRVKSLAVSQLVGAGVVFSHSSAAALWRLPRVGVWPQKEHALAANATAGGRSSSVLVRHASGGETETVQIDGMTVTGLARTVVDVAATHAFGEAVTTADAALRRTDHPQAGVPRTFLTKQALFDQLDALPMRHGSGRARRAIEFSNGLADRPGESLSRLNIHLAGLPAPELQAVLYGASGRRYVVDFWWSCCKLIGEFDGAFKYSDPEFMQGRTQHQVLLDEKKREDDLRAAGYRFSRWDMSTAVSPERLRALLLATGLR